MYIGMYLYIPIVTTMSIPVEHATQKYEHYAECKIDK